MSIDFSIVNLDKKQYLAPWKFGDSDSTSAYLQGDHALAIAMLVCNAQAIGIDPPAGSWAGDRVVAVMDCAPPNEFGIVTETEEDPKRNLYMMAWQDFHDYSYEAIAMLCDRTNSYAETLALRVKYDEENGKTEYARTRHLWHYGNVAVKLNCLQLRFHLDLHLGGGWIERYHEAYRIHAPLESDD